MKPGLLSIAALSLAACAAAPALPPPASMSAGAFINAPTDVAELPADWWRLYDDPALDALVTASLAANADLRAAYARLAGARAGTAQARAARLPQTRIESSATVDYPSEQPSASSVPSTDYDIAATVSWELDLFGRLRAAADAAQADAEATAAALDGLRVAVAADTVAAYVELCAAHESAAAADAVIAAQAELTANLRSQLTAGELSQLEVAQAESLLAATRASRPGFDAAAAIARYRLGELRGLMPADPLVAGIDCATLPELPAALPIGDAQALLRRRPDIREAERRLAAASARLGVATAELYPVINLGGAIGLLAGGLVSTATPLISWTFPNQSPARARIAQATANERAALAAWDAVTLRALREVESALLAMAAEAQRKAALTVAIGSAERTLLLAASRVRHGDASPLLRIEAERIRADLTRQRIDSSIALARQHLSLFRALGGGWQRAPAPLATAR
ncbi:efflux transporter outer membrane subunit [Nevskia sp.]|uniref:efflux transporter outer membrane subunit n=1 Tax=Nevskia sp. TaxID=1929292 RepID=UPI0025DECFC7|nr:efflux transporter outer membrane subunit [Nevskia sp.]